MLNKCCKCTRAFCGSVVRQLDRISQCRLIYMTSAVGNRSIHAITTPTTRRSIQDLCSRFSYHSTSFLRTHTTLRLTLWGWARLPSYFGFLRRPSNQFTYFSTDLLPIFISYNFVFCYFFLLYTNYSKKPLRFGFPGESLWLNLVVFVFLLLLRLFLLLYLVIVVVSVVVGLRRWSQLTALIRAM